METTSSCYVFSVLVIQFTQYLIVNALLSLAVGFRFSVVIVLGDIIFHGWLLFMTAVWFMV